jgi:2-iminobutanoate/2-iminopropanoate deaminase
LETIKEEPVRKAVMTEKGPKPLGPYSQAVVEGDFIFLAGQGCTNPLTGKLELGDVRSETMRTFENIRAILEAAGSSLNDVTKCNVYLRDIDDFTAMNEVYATFFSPPFPARTTIQAGALPGGIAVEIECIAKKGRKKAQKKARKKAEKAEKKAAKAETKARKKARPGSRNKDQ